VLVVGHRGAAGYAPENTLLSFQTAIDLGCDRVELDVHLTEDGIPVAIHDDSINRTTNGQGAVKNLTLSELKAFDCHQGQKIPSLQEVIDLCKNKIPLQIELKAPGTPMAVNELLLQNDIIDSSVVTSFDRKLLKEMKAINPEIKTGFLFKNPVFSLFPRRLEKLIADVSPAYICPRSDLVTGKMVDLVHAAGAKVYAYQVNKKALAESLIALGVDEIGTDFPKLFA